MKWDLTLSCSDCMKKDRVHLLAGCWLRANALPPAMEFSAQLLAAAQGLVTSAQLPAAASLPTGCSCAPFPSEVLEARNVSGSQFQSSRDHDLSSPAEQAQRYSLRRSDSARHPFKDQSVAQVEHANFELNSRAKTVPSLQQSPLFSACPCDYTPTGHAS